MPMSLKFESIVFQLGLLVVVFCGNGNWIRGDAPGSFRWLAFKRTTAKDCPIPVESAIFAADSISCSVNLKS